jgi:hypothetical protein
MTNVQKAGFRQDIGYSHFLYPSVQDVRQLLLWIVEAYLKYRTETDDSPAAGKSMWIAISTSVQKVVNDVDFRSEGKLSTVSSKDLRTHSQATMDTSVLSVGRSDCAVEQLLDLHELTVVSDLPKRKALAAAWK